MLKPSTKYLPKYETLRNLTTYWFDYATLSKNKIQKGQRLHPQIGNLRIPKDYRGITFAAISTHIYNPLLFNCIQPEVKKILWKY